MSTSHLQLLMTAQDYIQSALDQLKEPVELPQPKTQDELGEAIFRLLTSKKFRKYSLTEDYAKHIKNSIKENVQADKPINLTFLGGCYKLWRLDEAPESDWAELFTHMYFTRWVKPICTIYKPGVWFDFFLDDIIVSRINNLPESDVEAYRTSRQKILDFLKPYQPYNLNMTLTGISSLFESRDIYEKELEQSIQKLSSELPSGLPELSESQLATTALNVKATPEQLADPKWREKVELVHSAYMMVKGATGYSTASNKIRVFTQPFSNGTCIAVGTTKDSIAKFWVGVGALRPRDNSFRQLVFSPSQLENTMFDWEEVDISGLQGKNFSKIRLVR
ncbi:MAG TPA: hypothetical protein VLG16_02145 [Candidatus Saccharimonadales bacterium]|nr:hypothetical protein [Candidatus Saccharimonadales bacterium]